MKSTGSGIIYGVGTTWRLHDGFNNIVVNSGVDLMATLLAGRGVAPNTMYLEFMNTAGAPPVITPDAAEGRDYYAGVELNGDDNHGYLRLALAAQPQLESSDAAFNSDRVQFIAISNADYGLYGASAFSDVANSKVFGLALVAAVDAGDRSRDIVFARSYDFSYKQKLSGEEIAISWAHTVTA